MAVKLTSNSQFFEMVFGPKHPILADINALASEGVLINVSLFTMSAAVYGKTYQIQLTQGSTALMKGVVDAVLVEQNKKIIVDFVHGLMTTAKLVTVQVPIVEKKVSVLMTGTMTLATNLIPIIKAIREITGWSLGPAKQLAEKAKAGFDCVVIANIPVEKAVMMVAKLTSVGALAHVQDPVTGAPFQFPTAGGVAPELASKIQDANEKLAAFGTASHLAGAAIKKHGATVGPVSKVIPLREAMALGQKVNGTSSGSVYYTVALNERVRLAARIMSAGSISIRAEWQGATKAELEKMEASGMQVKSNYASIHFQADNVPFGRIIGAFVAGLGIHWDDAVMSSEDMVVS